MAFAAPSPWASSRSSPATSIDSAGTSTRSSSSRPILLGYVFNLARLCLLVLYYLVALHFTSLQNKAENADYLIGAALFLVATFLLFTVIHRLRGPVDRSLPPAAVTPHSTPAPGKRYAQLAVLAAIALFGCAGLARAVEAARANPAVDAAQLKFPHRIGSYTLARTWDETLIAGPVAYEWGQYVPADGGTPVAVGVSPVLGWHDPLLCHTIRGEHTLWQGQLHHPHRGFRSPSTSAPHSTTTG